MTKLSTKAANEIELREETDKEYKQGKYEVTMMKKSLELE